MQGVVCRGTISGRGEEEGGGLSPAGQPETTIWLH